MGFSWDKRGAQTALLAFDSPLCVMGCAYLIGVVEGGSEVGDEFTHFLQVEARQGPWEKDTHSFPCLLLLALGQRSLIFL